MSSHKNETDAKPFAASSFQQQLKLTVRGPTSRKKNESVKETKANLPRFTERQNLNQDANFEYKRSGTDPGTVLIFNQEVFDDEKLRIRRGSRRDVNEIILCFQRLGFNIYENNVHTDLTVQEILHQLDLVVKDKKALNETNCLIVFFLSHGHTNNELHGKDDVFKAGEIWSKFVTCEELQHKPKMFIFQACKGEYYTTTCGESSMYNPNDDPSKLVDFNNFSVNPLGPDMLLVYATIEGNLSFRNPLTGTWFIQELCKSFSSYGRRDDVISMITRAMKCVCGNYYNLDDDDKNPEIQKQMPIFISTLSKKFYLNRNKDRNILLNIQKETQEIHESINEIIKYIKIDSNRKSKR